MFSIAIDGTTSSGKSTLAGELAARLNIKRLDTGAIYRAIACRFKRLGLGAVNEKNVQTLVSALELKVVFQGREQHVFANGVDETPNLRTEEISLLTSEISSYQIVRQRVLSIQREFAKNNNCVMEGRDITTVVLPNADVKFYITASAEERAKRRHLQFMGKPNAPTYEDVLRDLKLRDQRDENREFGKLAVANDAHVIDTTGKTLVQVTDICQRIIEKQLKIK